MAKDNDAIIKAFLKKAKLNGPEFSETVLMGSLDNAIRERRVGNMQQVTYWLKHFIDEIRGEAVFDEQSHKIIANAAAAFVKKNGRFTYAAAFKKRAKEFKSLISTSKSKGAEKAVLESKRLHKSMVSSRELPSNISYEDFEKEILKSFKGKLDLSRDAGDEKPKAGAADKAIAKIKWQGVKSTFKLPSGVDSDLTGLAKAIYKSGPKPNQKLLTSAEEILSQSKSKRATARQLFDAVSAEMDDAIF